MSALLDTPAPEVKRRSRTPSAQVSPYALAIGDRSMRDEDSTTRQENLTANRGGDRRSTAPPSLRPPALLPKARVVNDTCAALGISRALFYKLRAQGKIRTIKIGGRTLVPESELDRLAREGASLATQP
jgi:excisionase family DNA binding protein